MKGLLPSLTLLVCTPSQTSILFVALEVSWIRRDPEIYSLASSGAHMVLNKDREKNQSPQKLMQETP